MQKGISARLESTKIGDPIIEGVRMGALATRLQVERVRSSVETLSKSQEIVFGDLDNFEVHGADKNNGAFFPPILFLNRDPFNDIDCHEIEAFGPVSTIMPYKTLDDAISLAKMGKG